MSDQQNSSIPLQSISPVTDLEVYARLVWRWAWLVILCALAAGVAAFVVSSNMTPIYQAKSQLLISPGSSNENDNYWYDGDRTASTLAQLMSNPTNLAMALDFLGIDSSVGDLSISAQHIRETDLLNLTVRGTSPELVAAVADILPQVVSTELRRVQSSRYAESKTSLQDQMDQVTRRIELVELELADLQDARTVLEALELGRLQSTLDRQQDSYAYLLESYEELRLAEAQALDSLVVMERAVIPTWPVSPRTSSNVLLAAIVGGMMALGLIFLVEFLDRRIRTPEDLKQVTTLPVLGTIVELSAERTVNGAGQSIDLVSATDPRNPTVESYRRLRTNLKYYNVDRGLHTLGVTSANPGEGKSATATNLAIVMAQSGKKVVLVDTDLRKPRLHRIFDLSRRPGLSDVLASGLPIEVSMKPIGPASMPGLPNLRILPAGNNAPNPAELLDSQRMRALVDHLKQESDVVIFDSPPLQAVTDAQLIGRLVDGTVLVVNSQKTSGSDLQRAIEMLEQVNAPIWGVVLNRLSKGGKGYDYYSNKYYSDSDDSNEPKGTPKLAPLSRIARSREAMRKQGLTSVNRGQTDVEETPAM